MIIFASFQSFIVFEIFKKHSRYWETDSYPVPGLGRITLSFSLFFFSLSLSLRFPDRSPVVDKNRAPMGPEILSSTGAEAWRKASMAFPDSSSVLEKFQSARCGSYPSRLVVERPRKIGICSSMRGAAHQPHLPPKHAIWGPQCKFREIQGFL